MRSLGLARYCAFICLALNFGRIWILGWQIDVERVGLRAVRVYACACVDIMDTSVVRSIVISRLRNSWLCIR